MQYFEFLKFIFEKKPVPKSYTLNFICTNVLLQLFGFLFDKNFKSDLSLNSTQIINKNIKKKKNK
jgi:hypothetical protein